MDVHSFAQVVRPVPRKWSCDQAFPATLGTRHTTPTAPAVRVVRALGNLSTARLGAIPRAGYTQERRTHR
jgi:hypothetical protein